MCVCVDNPQIILTVVNTGISGQDERRGDGSRDTSKPPPKRSCVSASKNLPDVRGILRMIVSCYSTDYPSAKSERILSKVSMSFFDSSKAGLRALSNTRILLRCVSLNSFSTLFSSMQSAMRSGSSRIGTG
jgi:hypothetical protein